MNGYPAGSGNPNFCQNPTPAGQNVNVTATIPNVPNGTTFSVYFNSELETGTMTAMAPVGRSTLDSVFNWGLTIKTA